MVPGISMGANAPDLRSAPKRDVRLCSSEGPAEGRAGLHRWASVLTALVARSNATHGSETSDEPCPYPESLGGADQPDACGVIRGAWYPLGDSDVVT